MNPRSFSPVLPVGNTRIAVLAGLRRAALRMSLFKMVDRPTELRLCFSIKPDVQLAPVRAATVTASVASIGSMAAVLPQVAVSVRRLVARGKRARQNDGDVYTPIGASGTGTGRAICARMTKPSVLALERCPSLQRSRFGRSIVVAQAHAAEGFEQDFAVELGFC
jgi:hypothetical protein